MPEDTLLNSANLLDFNIKPRDILDILPAIDLKTFVADRNIKSRGDLVLNILDAYKDAENLMLENYEAIGLDNPEHTHPLSGIKSRIQKESIFSLNPDLCQISTKRSNNM